MEDGAPASSAASDGRVGGTTSFACAASRLPAQ